MPVRVELILVDDGSVDATLRVAATIRNLIRDSGTECYIHTGAHRGKGAAIARGVAAARGSLVAFCDVDLSVSLYDFDLIIGAARNIQGLAIGSRAAPGSIVAKPESRVRELLGRTYNWIVRSTLLPGIDDTQCGAKAAPRKIWNEILCLSSEEGWAWDVEILLIAQNLGYSILEIPVTWSHDARSRVKLSRDGLDMLVAIIRIRDRHGSNTAQRNGSSCFPSDSVLRCDTPIDPMGIQPKTSIFNETQAATLVTKGKTHWWFENKARMLTVELNRMNARRHGLLIDVGAGSAEVTRLLAGGYQKVAVEPSPRLVTEALNRGLPAVRASGEALPFADNSAMVVCLLDVIEHLEDPVPTLREALRVLEDAGTLLISVPAHQWLWSRADEFLGHFRRYTLLSLRTHVEEAGLDIVNMYHVFSWLTPFVWLARCLPGRTAEARLGLQSNGYVTAKIARLLTTIELRMGGTVRLPFGTTIIASARPKPLPEN